MKCLTEKRTARGLLCLHGDILPVSNTVGIVL